ncbi:hypothetical protein GPECTOR_58g577 [Gonium pectorale]|uniref:Rad60/SUMO-like domain-containing protein n=1 Tax=Gonium pectorale TaxID=33097 RepID=A0A150G5N3_GONPE|nr:hypothetical protein GPECTOR_58g577 [Gonium pectorale]|eukprot:KXZ45128.1 hypothetical protein GPECTOR_58g577 [Gonium pectorale]
MSGLWDYDDEEDDLNVDDGDWNVQSQGQVVEVVEDSPGGKKRRGRPKGSGRPKRQAVAPAPTDADLRSGHNRPITIDLDGSDDEDDIVMMPSPDGKPRATPPKGAGKPLTAPQQQQQQPGKGAGVAHLNPETQKSFAREHDLLRRLQEATECAPPLDEPDPGPVHSLPRLRPLSFPSLAPIRATPITAGAAANGRGGGIGGGGDACGVTPVAGAAAAAGRNGSADLGLGEGPSGAAGATPAAAPPPAAAPAAEDRVCLKLAWAAGKDGFLMMRVVKTDPIGKMLHKFREIATQRSLCKDPKRIKFLLDGDDLAKAPESTPEDLDLEDDVIIDVKF